MRSKSDVVGWVKYDDGCSVANDDKIKVASGFREPKEAPATGSALGSVVKTK